MCQRNPRAAENGGWRPYGRGGHQRCRAPPRRRAGDGTSPGGMCERNPSAMIGTGVARRAEATAARGGSAKGTREPQKTADGGLGVAAAITVADRCLAGAPVTGRARAAGAGGMGERNPSAAIGTGVASRAEAMAARGGSAKGTRAPRKTAGGGLGVAAAIILADRCPAVAPVTGRARAVGAGGMCERNPSVTGIGGPAERADMTAKRGSCRTNPISY
jgi:hypothetical protein